MQLAGCGNESRAHWKTQDTLYRGGLPISLETLSTADSRPGSDLSMMWEIAVMNKIWRDMVKNLGTGRHESCLWLVGVGRWQRMKEVGLADGWKRGETCVFDRLVFATGTSGTAKSCVHQPFAETWFQAKAVSLIDVISSTSTSEFGRWNFVIVHSTCQEVSAIEWNYMLIYIFFSLTL